MDVHVVSMAEMVELALCNPEKGAVNFNVLHTLLLGMISKLGFENVQLELKIEPEPVDSAFWDGSSEDEKPQKGTKEKGPGVRKNPLTEEVVRFATKVKKIDPSRKGKMITEIWKSTNMKSRMDAAEEGMDKLVKLIDGIIEEAEALKREWQEKEKKSQGVGKDVDALSALCKKLKTQVDGCVVKTAFSEAIEQEEKKIKQLQTDFAELKSLKAEVSKLVSKAQLKDAVVELEDEIDKLGKKIAKVEEENKKKKIPDEDEMMKKLKAKLDEFVTKAALKTSEEKQTKRMDDLQNQINKKGEPKDDKKMQSLLNDVENLKAQLSAFITSEEVHKMVEELKERMNQLEGGLPTGGMSGEAEMEMRNKIADLEQRVSKLEEAVTDIRQELDKLSKQVSTLMAGQTPQEEVSLLEIYEKLKKLQEKIEELAKQTNNLLSDHAAKKKDIEFIQSSISPGVEGDADMPYYGRRSGLDGCEDMLDEYSGWLQELLSRLATNELSWMRTIHDVSTEMDEQMEADSMVNLQERLQQRLGFIMGKLRAVRGPEYEHPPRVVESEPTKLTDKTQPGAEKQKIKPLTPGHLSEIYKRTIQEIHNPRPMRLLQKGSDKTKKRPKKTSGNKKGRSDPK